MTKLMIAWVPIAISLVSLSVADAAYARVDRDGRREAELVGSVVHAERQALDVIDLLSEHRQQRQRQVAVGDGSAERALLGRLDVDVDPLLVSGRVGERVDLRLVDRVPVTRTDLFTDDCLELVETLEHAGHAKPLSTTKMRTKRLLSSHPSTPTCHRARASANELTTPATTSSTIEMTSARTTRFIDALIPGLTAGDHQERDIADEHAADHVRPRVLAEDRRRSAPRRAGRTGRRGAPAAPPGQDPRP